MSKYSEKSFLKSFGYALRGLKLAIKSQKNFRRQIITAILALSLAIILKFTLTEFCLIIIVIGMVLFAELFNSVIEFLLDAVYKNNYSKLVEMAKDMAAGSVCIVSSCAFVVGTLLYISKIIKLFWN